MDIATLGLRADSREIRTATGDLNKMTGASGRTRDNLGRFTKAEREAELGAKGLGRQVKSTTSVVGQLKASVFAAAAAFVVVTKASFTFQGALAEVSTLVDTSTFSMEALKKSALEQAKIFGSAPTQQAKAMYQIISAGASTATDATNLLNAANKLAVGGVTSVGVAAGGLSSLLNAYGLSASNAGAVSDALFVGMRAGQTTIGELSSSLGQVAPLAAKSGASLDEMVATVAALTKGGVSTTAAVTGVRAILASVVKPTSEATKQAKALGLEFSAAALKSKGFQAFIEDVVDKTGGTTDVIAQLFGGVEALVPMLALAGQAGDDLSDIMVGMADKFEQAEMALDKINQTGEQQSSRVWSAMVAEVLEMSSGLSEMLTPALKFAADNMGAFADIVQITTFGLIALSAPAIISGVVGLTAAMGGLLLAVNPLAAVFAILVATGTALMVVNKDSVTPVATHMEAIKLLKQQVQGLKSSNVDAVNTTREKIKSDITATRAALERAKAELKLAQGLALRETLSGGTLPNLSGDIPSGPGRGVPNGFANVVGPVEGLAAQIKDAEKSLTELQNLYLKVDAIIYTPPKVDDVLPVDEIVTSITNVGDATKAAQNAYDSIILSANQRIAQMQTEQQVIGMTEEAANRLRYTQELMNKAVNDNIDLSPMQRRELEGIAGQMAATEAELNSLTEAYDFNKGTFNSMLGDMRTNLKSGQTLWDSFGNAALSALDKITDRALSMATDGIFDMIFGGASASSFAGSSGGLFGGAIIPGILHDGGVAGSDGYGTGRSFSASTWSGAPRYHNGGIAGLRPDEVPAILQRGEVVIPANGNNRGSGASDNKTVHINQTFVFDGAVSLQDVQTMAQQGAERAVETVRSNMQRWNVELNTNGGFG